MERSTRMPRERADRRVTVIVLAVSLFAGVVVSGLGSAGLLGLQLAAVVGLAGLVALFLRPDLGLLLAMFLAVDVLFLGELIDIRVLGGGFELKDILFGVMAAIIWVRGSVDRHYRPPMTLMAGGVLLFLVMALVSGLWALARGVPLLDALQDLRSLFYYIMFFLACGAIRDPRHARLVLRGLLTIAVIAAVVSIVQYVVGPEVVITGGRVEQRTVTSGATRVVLPGTEFVNIMLLFAVCLAVFAPRTKTRLAYLALAGFFGLAVLLSFSRILWLADLVVLAFFIVLVERRIRRQIMIVAVVALAVLALGVLLLAKLPVSASTGITLTEALGNRIAEIMGGDITQLETLDGRLGEIELAWEPIRMNPLLGIGLGAAYYGASDSP